MTVLREELEVDRSIGEVFGFIADFANSARWDPGVAESRNVTDGPVRIGTRYDLIVLFNDRRLPMTYEVIGTDRPTGSSSAAPDRR